MFNTLIFVITKYLCCRSIIDKSILDMSFRKLLLAVLVLFTLCVSTGFSQNRNKKSTEFKNLLWYGGSAGLGYQSYQSQSTFLLALYPMVGYKLTEAFSVGPRIGIAYQYIKSIGADGRTYNFHPLEISGALFGRAKVYRAFFAHLEYEVAQEKNPVRDFNGIPFLLKQTENNFYIGGGYNSGGRVASEIYILYNVLEEASSLEIPWVFRFGITVGF